MWARGWAFSQSNFFCQVLVGGEASINQMRLKILAQGQVTQTCPFGLFQLNVEAHPGGVPCLHFKMPCVTLSMSLDVSVAVGIQGKEQDLEIGTLVAIHVHLIILAVGRLHVSVL